MFFAIAIWKYCLPSLIDLVKLVLECSGLRDAAQRAVHRQNSRDVVNSAPRNSILSTSLLAIRCRTLPSACHASWTTSSAERLLPKLLQQTGAQD